MEFRDSIDTEASDILKWGQRHAVMQLSARRAPAVTGHVTASQVVLHDDGWMEHKRQGVRGDVRSGSVCCIKSANGSLTWRKHRPA